MKRLLALFFCLAMCLVFAGCNAKKNDEENTENNNDNAGISQTQNENDEVKESTEPVSVRVGALKGPTAMGLVKLMNDSDSEEDTGICDYEFSILASPEEITQPLIKGELDIAAVPANLASILYNSTDGQIQTLAINTLGVLYIVENGDSVHSVEDLRGKTIYASGKGATPEYALNFMLESNGLEIGKDVNVEFRSEHSECVAAITASEDAVALLPQPFVTTAMAANENIRIAIDLTKEWENASDCTLVTGVMVARKDFVQNHKDALDLFLEQYADSVDYVNENAKDASALVENYGIVKAAVAEKAIPYCNIVCITGSQMKDKLAGYLEVLYGQNPKAVGGKLPDDGFYYGE